MADTWLTIEQAAVALGLSVRTVNRHIVAGKIQSRLNDGRREVLVDMPDDVDAAGATHDAPPSAASPFAAEQVTIDSQGADYARQASDYARQTQDHVRQASQGPMHGHTIDPNTVLALADNAAEKAELAISAYQALARSTDMQFQHVRRSARFAWGSVAVMAAGVAVAVGWTTHHLTKAHVEGRHLEQQVRATTNAADRAAAERDRLRTELSAAREQAARAEGQVTALSEPAARDGGQPTPPESTDASVEKSASDVSDGAETASVGQETTVPAEPAQPSTRPVIPSSILDRLFSRMTDKAD